MTKLSVNLNKIALLRNSRMNGIPCLIDFVKTAILSGANGITVHPRPDERHITVKDIIEISQFLRDHREVELNIEGNPRHNLMQTIREITPAQCTLVPDELGALTSTQGWNLKEDIAGVRPFINELKDKGVRVSLFMAPQPQQIALVKESGADRVELYTEPFAKAYEQGDVSNVIDDYALSTKTAIQLGLEVNAGHDLNQRNLEYFLRKVRGIKEVSIGHALIVDSLYEGFSNTVKNYVDIVSGT